MQQVNLSEWVAKYVPREKAAAALVELRMMTGAYENVADVTHPGMSESAVQQRVRYEFSRQYDGVAWRNNVGALPAKCPDCGASRQPIRWGLANESKAENEVRKSSDLVGLYPVLIQQHHVGQVFGRFWCRETKKGDWVYAGTDHERAQYNYIMLVNSLGGDAAFTNGKGTFR